MAHDWTEDGWGHTGFTLGRQRLGWVMVDHHGDGRISLSVEAPPGEVDARVAQDPARYFVPANVQHRVGVELFAVEPDWAEVETLFEQAWRMPAGKRAVAAYDLSR